VLRLGPEPDDPSDWPQAKPSPAVAKAAPASAMFGHVLARGRTTDALAVDDAQAKARVSVFIQSLRLRPRDTGDLGMAHRLEGAGLLMMGLGRALDEARRLAFREEARLELAAPLGRPDISEVAARWQFADSSHFIRAFKKQYGETPA
jgi:Helix-turn-helix domain